VKTVLVLCDKAYSSLCAFRNAMLGSFRKLAQIFGPLFIGMQHLTKDVLTTKSAKDTKVSDIFDAKLRDFRGLRGECFFLLRCGLSAPGPSW
jgi:hypothetical protein